MAADENPSSRSSKRVPWWAVVTIVVLLVLALFGDKGVLRALQAHRQEADLEAQVRDLEAANASLRREIEALRNDPRTIENLARKELGMVKDGELVYQFRNQPHPALSAPAKASEGNPGERTDPAGSLDSQRP